MVDVYLEALKGKIFKILPVYEENPDNSRRYVKLLNCELMGVVGLFPVLKERSTL